MIIYLIILFINLIIIIIVACTSIILCQREEKKTAPVLVHVFENTHMLLGRVEWGVLTFMLTCVACTCHVTSWVGWGGGC